MRKFNVTVNGTPYIVDIEEITGSAPVYQAPVAPVAPAVVYSAPVAEPAPKAEPAPQAAPKLPSDGFKFTTPMPGTVIRYVVKDGSDIKKGEAAFILESMKMENEIVAPVSGKISFVIREGVMVNAGDTIAIIA